VEHCSLSSVAWARQLRARLTARAICSSKARRLA
jgi:hypothetical protein